MAGTPCRRRVSARQASNPSYVRSRGHTRRSTETRASLRQTRAADFVECRDAWSRAKSAAGADAVAAAASSVASTSRRSCAQSATQELTTTVGLVSSLRFWMARLTSRSRRIGLSWMGLREIHASIADRLSFNVSKLSFHQSLSPTAKENTMCHGFAGSKLGAPLAPPVAAKSRSALLRGSAARIEAKPRPARSASTDA